MAKQLPEIIERDKSLNELCKNSIDLVEYARRITAKQINIIQLQYGRGFSVDTLENARRFFLTYQDRISETVFSFFEKEVVYT